MQRLATDVDGGDAGGRQHDILFARVGADILEESALSGAGLSGEENRLSGVLNQVPHVLELRVVEVDIFGQIEIHLSQFMIDNA